MRALVLTHHPSEGPGNIGSFLQSRGVSLDIIPLFAGGKIPPDALYYDSIISMGGPMNVYEEDLYPFLREETALLQKALRFKTPLLGICLGAQMIAKAAGARVVQSPEKELGWRKVGLTGLGKSDRLFLGLPDRIYRFSMAWRHVPDSRRGRFAGIRRCMPSSGVQVRIRLRPSVPCRGHPGNAGGLVLWDS